MAVGEGSALWMLISTGRSFLSISIPGIVFLSARTSNHDFGFLLAIIHGSRHSRRVR